MRHNTLGASGIIVGDLAFGAMNFGYPGGPTDEVAVGMIHKALDAGIDLIDTADVIGEIEKRTGRSEPDVVT